MKLWKYDYEKRDVRLVDCPNGTWPGRDVEGESVCENTHFEDEEEAWKTLEREFEASMEMDARQRRDVAKRLEQLTRSLADAAQGLVEVKEKRAKRERERSSTP